MIQITVKAIGGISYFTRVILDMFWFIKKVIGNICFSFTVTLGGKNQISFIVIFCLIGLFYYCDLKYISPYQSLISIEYVYVTYWHATQPSIKKQVHPVENIRVSSWRVEFGAIAALRRSRWVSNYNITRCHRQVQLVEVSLLEFELQFEAVRTSSRQRTWSLRTSVEQPSRMRKVLLWPEELGVNMLQSVQPLTHLSHTTLLQPFRIKCEKYVCSSLLLIKFPHIYVYV